MKMTNRQFENLSDRKALALNDVVNALIRATGHDAYAASVLEWRNECEDALSGLPIKAIDELARLMRVLPQRLGIDS